MSNKLRCILTEQQLRSEQLYDVSQHIRKNLMKLKAQYFQTVADQASAQIKKISAVSC